MSDEGCKTEGEGMVECSVVTEDGTKVALHFQA